MNTVPENSSSPDICSSADHLNWSSDHHYRSSLRRFFPQQVQQKAFKSQWPQRRLDVQRRLLAQKSDEALKHLKHGFQVQKLSTVPSLPGMKMPGFLCDCGSNRAQTLVVALSLSSIHAKRSREPFLPSTNSATFEHLEVSDRLDSLALVSAYVLHLLERVSSQGGEDS